MNWKQFWGICEHKWREVEQFEKIGSESGKWKGNIYKLMCEKCGDIKHRYVGL